ncbi:MAG: hypothetical protein IPK21_05575 [Haliscomenobacter sp.]|jgi:hypothetical protein|nr:hypothetical protein [Haliscomenobacter sp.]
MRYLLLFFLYFLTLPIAKGKQVKILVIGNSICEYNDMLGLFQNIALLNGKEVKIKATFEGGASIAENICKNLIPGCRIINYKVESPYWFKENKQFSFFIDIFKKYDYVLFQGRSASDSHFLEISKSIANSISKKQTIFIFQNYSSILWNDSLRRVSLEKDKAVFQTICNSNKRIKLFRVGDLFDFAQICFPETMLLRSNNHPEPTGSLLIGVYLYDSIFNEFPAINIKKNHKKQIYATDELERCINIVNEFKNE